MRASFMAHAASRGRTRLATPRQTGQPPSRRQVSAAPWMGLSALAALALAAAALMVAGTGRRGTDLGLLLTARLAFLLFWPAYTGSSLVALFGPAFQKVKRHGREFGLTFATVLLVHLGLVAWLCWIGAVPSTATFVLFGTAAVLVYLIALFSIGRLQQWLGVAGWSLLRLIGMNFVAYAFAVDFLRNPFGGGIERAAFYWPFAALSIVGPGLNLAAAARRIVWKRRDIVPRTRP